MNRRIAPAYAVALVLLDVAAVWSQDSTASGSLPCRTPFVRFDVINGRLATVCTGQTPPRSATAAHPSGVPTESLTMTAETGKPMVRYQFTDEQQDLVIEFQAGSDVRISREPRGGSGMPRIKFEQLVGSDLKLIVENGDTKKQCSAPTLWHLLLAEPAACQEHLLPALARLRTDWLLCERAKRLQASLVDLCQSGAIEQRRRCAALVDQLASGNYQTRQDADHELRGLGQIALSYLKRLDLTRLDAEQRQRIRRISDSLSVCTGDTPERMAAWMLDDQAIWFTLLSHAKAEYRHEAVLQLSRLCDRPIEFDPAAAEIERNAQIERLRERLAKGL